MSYLHNTLYRLVMPSGNQYIALWDGRKFVEPNHIDQEISWRGEPAEIESLGIAFR